MSQVFKGRPYYQGAGKKYFYSPGDARGRQAARLKAQGEKQGETGLFHGGAVDPALLAKYAGKAHPSFIEKYAHILSDRPRMMGWRASVPSNEWYPEEHAAYLRDGSPKSREDFARIMGTWGNPRSY